MGTLEAVVLLYMLLAKHALADLLIQSLRKPGDKTNLKDPKGYPAMDPDSTPLAIFLLTTNQQVL